MTAFRDQLAVDAGVFLDLEAFGEQLVVDGVTVTAVRDDDLTIERTQGPPPIDGVFTSRTILHLASGLIPRPVEGQRLAIGTAPAIVRWYVRQVSEAEGMLELTLERQET